jgi:hypothetical protein
MYPGARQQLTRPAMTHAEQHRNLYLAEVSAAKRVAAADMSYRTRGRRRALSMPRLRLLLHLGKRSPASAN